MGAHHPLFERFKAPDNKYALPGLGITVWLAEDECIRNDGFVHSIAEHTRQLIAEHTRQLALEIGAPTTDDFVYSWIGREWEEDPDSDAAGGVCVPLNFTDGTIQAVIYYQDVPEYADEQIRNAQRIVFQGHEESHALHVLDQLDVIRRLACSIMGKGIKLPSFAYDSEIVANVGGILALLKRGYDVGEVSDIILYNLAGNDAHHYFREALRVLHLE
ncbi:MAG: hypothetical protein V1659_00195 [Candidatus Woesearchaeota archaeon]